MSFSKEKFLSLAPQNRAKKLADLVAAYIKEGTRESLDELRRLGAWQEISLTIPEEVSLHDLAELYTSLRTEAGMGIEQSVIDALDARSPDRSKSISAPFPWWVCLHNGRSAFNAGSVIRTADCFGLSGVVLTGYTAKTDNKSLKSAAMGTQDWFPVEYATGPAEWLSGRAGENLTVVALETTPDAIDIDDFQWPKSGLLLLGNEELGLSQEILDLADAKLRIPMHGRKNSLNLANAFAVAAWEIRRRHES